MRNKGLIATMVFGLLLVLAMLLFSCTGSPSLQVAEETSTGNDLTTEIIESNTSTEEARDQGGVPLVTVPAIQTAAVTNETSAVVSATFPSSQNGAVSIVTDKGEYTVGETIVVTVTNNLNIPITTLNQQAFCTIIRMELQKDGNWQEVKNCYSGEPVAEVTIKPGEKVVKQLETPASGTYRVGLIYSEGDAYDRGKLLAVFTVAFEVKG
jgi:hypothetical protein